MANKIVNLTLHTLNIYDPDGQDVVMSIEPSGDTARVNSTTVIVGEINGIPVVKTSFTAVEGLPEPEPGAVYVTSTLVAQAAHRPDVIAPDTGPQSAVRDEGGRIRGVRRFQMFD